MANKRISELTSITGANLADADLLVVVDVSDTTMASSGTNKKITMAELAKDSALTDNLIAKTTLTTDGDVLTRAAGAPARITRADLAQDSAFSSRYVPLASDRIFLGTNSWGVMTGNPVVGTLGNATNAQQRTSAMLLDGTSNEGIITSFVMPTGWASASFHIWWSNAGAGSGDIYWTINALNMADAATSDAFGSTIYNGAVTAPAQYVVKRTSGTGTLTATAGQLVRLNIIRLPGDPGDTLTNDIGVIAVEVVRAS